MFRKPKRRIVERRSTASSFEVSKEQDYPSRLNLYGIPPLSEITLDQFEEWALDRLRVLGEIEVCLFRNKVGKTLEQVVKPVLDKYLPLSSNFARASKGSSQLDAERKKDHYSHFILRLAFCRSEELRRRFVRAESVLFRLRFQLADSQEKQAFVASLNLDWEPVGDEERAAVAEQLAATAAFGADAGDSYFKVDFERVPDLIEARSVFLRGGKAYIASAQQLMVVMSEFESRLMRGLELTARALPRLDEDDRLVPILNHVSKGFVAPEYVAGSLLGAGEARPDAVRADDVPKLQQHFPLCMRTLQSALDREHHMQHFGRLQYGLFLKGIGLSVDEALQFWRRSFSVMTDDKFNKEYRYYVRHSYGLEGSHHNYRPYSCQNIIAEKAAPGPKDHHGCPFRHAAWDKLSAALDEIGVADAPTLRAIKDDVDKKHFHVACTRVFEATHPARAPGAGAADDGEAITHPNLYYDRSVMYARKLAEAPSV
ncbi:eukaryotic and archaeal DNA primase, large subunit-domain-containing protein [Dipodascopsis tothii]|uniref:eukaryotic and archaeal DNA primase, large subunit-domain-containing protein n=1 Tax=Dipodascopsis tothii TaxID=44089 RepID=UPI0034CFEB59